jgi:hypothetical protein
LGQYRHASLHDVRTIGALARAIEGAISSSAGNEACGKSGFEECVSRRAGTPRDEKNWV